MSSPVLAGNRPRVIETCLLGLGRVALMAVEGPMANPSTVDLITEAYRTIHARKELRGGFRACGYRNCDRSGLLRRNVAPA